MNKIKISPTNKENIAKLKLFDIKFKKQQKKALK